MYNNFYYTELLILIPLVLSAYLLNLALNRSLDDELRNFSTVFSFFFGILLFLMMFSLGAGLPNSFKDQIQRQNRIPLCRQTPSNKLFRATKTI